MRHIPHHIVILIKAMDYRTLTLPEENEVAAWYNSYMDDVVEVKGDGLTEKDVRNRIKKNILIEVKKQHKQKWVTYVAAASVIGLLILGGLFVRTNKSFFGKSETGINQHQPSQKILPGGNKAILTLANGSTIVLDSIHVGSVAQQGNLIVKKLTDGQLIYEVEKPGNTYGASSMEYNAISTPRGGQYMIVLADGTRVWLNASSTIHFPVAFTGKERSVDITGEAYFEVAHNEKMPFLVHTAGQVIEVLGTHFNINAYEDEDVMRATLLEGSVKIISSTKQSQLLHIGKQLSISKQGIIGAEKTVDVDKIIAWKNGYFHYSSDNLKTIMRQLARWYNVDVVYKGNVDLHFTGQLPRKSDVTSVIEKLELTGEAHFTVKGNQILITP